MSDWEDDAPSAPVVPCKVGRGRGFTPMSSDLNGQNDNWSANSDCNDYTSSNFVSCVPGSPGRGFRDRGHGRGGHDRGGRGGSRNFSSGFDDGSDDDGGNSDRGQRRRGRGFSSRGGGGGGGGECFKCKKMGHLARDCTESSFGNFGSSDRAPFKSGFGDGGSDDDSGFGSRGGRGGFGRGGGGGGGRECYKCKKSGHIARDCTEEGSGTEGGFGGSRGSSDKGCFKCGKEGHFSRECPSADSSAGGGAGGSKGCFKCKEEGHLARDCPNPEKASAEPGPDGVVRPPAYIPTIVDVEELFNEGINIGDNFDAYEQIPVDVTGAKPIPAPISSFPETNLRPVLLENIKRAGYRKPTPIQKYAIPIVMGGRDLMACAQTGSGKTAAFMLPILHYILENKCDSGAMEECAKPHAVIIAPTRELAVQISDEGRKFASSSVIRIVLAYGGVTSSFQLRNLQQGCHVLVATPGRLIDFVNRGRIAFDNVKFFVLDEADRMFDMGFRGDIEKVLTNPSMPEKMDRQSLMFSATFPMEIQKLARNSLNNYVFIAVGMVGAANTDVFQSVIKVSKFEKRETLLSCINDILARCKDEKILVFVETKRTADFLATYLSTKGMSSTSIHGDRFQNQREEALHEFKSGVRSILVATAVAARGLDIKGVGQVINYDLPSNVDEYVHRIGRTGRVGNRGKALSFFDESLDGQIAKDLVKILSDAEQEVPDWLMSAAETSGYAQTYHGRGDFASSDMRAKTRGGGSSNVAFGGPQVPPQMAEDEEEEW